MFRIAEIIGLLLLVGGVLRANFSGGFSGLGAINIGLFVLVFAGLAEAVFRRGKKKQ